MQDSTYYKVWYILQKQDIAFFTYSEEVQNLLIVFFLVCIANKVCFYLSKYLKQ